MRIRRAAFLVLLAIAGFWTGAILAKLERDVPPIQRAHTSIGWEDGGVVVHD